MSEKKQPDATQKLTEAFGASYQRAVQNAVDVQQRNVQLAQGWVEGLTGVMESQAETNRALTRAMESYTKVVEEALQSQERTNRALTESLEAYKEVLDRTSKLQEKNTELVQGFFGNVTEELREQMQSNQEILREFMGDSEHQVEAFRNMLAEAMDSYMQLMSAPFSLYQKNLEALERRKE